MNELKLYLVLGINYFTQFLEIMILIRIILSWLPISHDNIISRIVQELTEPILGPIRNLIYKSPLGGPGMILDFSPIIAVFAINSVARLIVTLLLR